jgi:hypothetical protein
MHLMAFTSERSETYGMTTSIFWPFVVASFGGGFGSCGSGILRHGKSNLVVRRDVDGMTGGAQKYVSWMKKP